MKRLKEFMKKNNIRFDYSNDNQEEVYLNVYEGKILLAVLPFSYEEVITHEDISD